MSSRACAPGEELFHSHEEANHVMFMGIGDVQYFAEPEPDDGKDSQYVANSFEITYRLHAGDIVGDAALWLKWLYCGVLWVRQISEMTILDVTNMLEMVQSGVAKSSEIGLLRVYAKHA